MKILFNCLDLEKGGAQRVISILANHFSNKNEVAILMLRQKDIRYEINESVSLFSVTKVGKISNFQKILAKMSLIKLIKMQTIIKKINPDIIISFLPEPSLKLMFPISIPITNIATGPIIPPTVLIVDNRMDGKRICAKNIIKPKIIAITLIFNKIFLISKLFSLQTKFFACVHSKTVCTTIYPLVYKTHS